MSSASAGSWRSSPAGSKSRPCSWTRGAWRSAREKVMSEGEPRSHRARNSTNSSGVTCDDCGSSALLSSLPLASSGRRKTATATATLRDSGSGKITVNGIDYTQYFPVLQDRCVSNHLLSLFLVPSSTAHTWHQLVGNAIGTIAVTIRPPAGRFEYRSRCECLEYLSYRRQISAAWVKRGLRDI